MRPERRCLCAAILMLLSCAGCTPFATRFEVLSFKDSDTPELFAESFPRGACSQGPDNKWEIVFELKQSVMLGTTAAERPAGSQPAEPLDDDAAESVPLRQSILIRLIWRARPGVTFAESTQTNASIVYCLQSGGDYISYEGAGFVYIKSSRDGKSISGAIESGSLVPTRRAGSPIDHFGPCHIRGKFTAGVDRRRVVEVIQDLRSHLGPAPAPTPTVEQPSPR